MTEKNDATLGYKKIIDYTNVELARRQKLANEKIDQIIAERKDK